MDYELRFEGFPVDDELRERLLLDGRRFVLEVAAAHPVRMAVRQIDGFVQGRVEIRLPARRVEVLVRRRSAELALGAAMELARGLVETPA